MNPSYYSAILRSSILDIDLSHLYTLQEGNNSEQASGFVITLKWCEVYVRCSLCD